MHLSRRLRCVAGLVPKGCRLADVGTDHGYIPIYLVKKGVCQTAIAADIKKGPLARAQEHITQYGLERQIEVRLSDGLGNVAPGEADCMVAAGMGGALTIHILEQGSEVVSKMQACILQPQSEIAKVRKYLWEHGFCIEKEDMVFEDGRFYPMMRVLPNHAQTVKKELYELYTQFGQYLLEKPNPVFRQYLEKEQKNNQKLLRQLQQKLPDTKKRVGELQEQSNILKQAAELIREA